MENEVTNIETPIGEIRTAVALPVETNDQNDCGPLAVEMLLRTDKKEEAMSLQILREGLNKEGNEGTLPGNLCKFLQEQGYSIEYFTTIPWEKYEKSFGEDLEHLPEEAKFFEDYIRDNFINANKLNESAKWLQKHPEIQKRQRLTYNDIASFLQQGKRIITIVGGDHYLVITGIDSHQVYFNNPDFFITKPNGERVYFDTREQSISLEDFEEWVTRNINSTEAIVVTPKAREEALNIQKQTRKNLESYLEAAE